MLPFKTDIVRPIRQHSWRLLAQVAPQLDDNDIGSCSGTVPGLDPHVALWAAVLWRAFLDTREIARDYNRDHETFRNSTAFRLKVIDIKKWIFSRRESEGSLIFLCEILDLDHQAIQKKFIAVISQVLNELKINC